jgi:DNA polymerase-1
MAINHPIQGTASDIVKTAMIRVQRFIEERGLKALMVLQVHDELVFEVPRDEIDGLAPELCRIMESATELTVPLKVDLKLGDNWEEMHGLETRGEGREHARSAGAGDDKEDARPSPLAPNVHA